jgi:hypothetical protein
MGLADLGTRRRITMVVALCAAAGVVIAGCGGGSSPKGSEIPDVTAFQRRAQSQGLGCRDYAAKVSLRTLQSGTCTLSVDVKKARCRTGKGEDVTVQQQAEGTGAGCGPYGEVTAVTIAPKNPKVLAYFAHSTCKQLAASRVMNPSMAPIYIVRGRNWTVVTSNEGLGTVVAARMGGTVTTPNC